ncbi:unnamed protein product [Paramecium sonneborni]|uniref:Uncharacterized protein n=1 Tax=Paramecium sonneborni TaxID=65129 RepID=A0A8S1RD47_9CILI|nr:unnamed protein product [Paramecium sonneborni]
MLSKPHSPASLKISHINFQHYKMLITSYIKQKQFLLLFITYNQQDQDHCYFLCFLFLSLSSFKDDFGYLTEIKMMLQMKFLHKHQFQTMQIPYQT